MEKDVAGDTSGNFAKLLLALVQVRPGSTRLCDLMCTVFKNVIKTYMSHVYISVQTKRDEPSSIIDYEKIDSDARVSQPFHHIRQSFEINRTNLASIMFYPKSSPMLVVCLVFNVESC